jgi:hypothetical protein
MNKTNMTRRDFLKGVASLILGFLAVSFKDFLGLSQMFRKDNKSTLHEAKYWRNDRLAG